MYLNEIIEHKRNEIKGLIPSAQSRTRAVLDPLDHLREKPFICEIKKASPSRGAINQAVDIVGQARLYERGGAGAVSVLTDARYFQGSYGFLTEIAGAVKTPLLCKDFIISEIQIDNAFAHGADFILLIASILNVRELYFLTRRAHHYSMKVLYEIHEAEEFRKIKALDPEMVGVNSRDLKTFAINKEKAMGTIGSLNGDFMKIAESGIETADDIIRFRKAGADAYLIGTALMTAGDPAAKLKEFHNALVRPCS
ncbi:MAG: indole-3-glycerol-phosphate synthase [Spirochaetes bacterium]|nr:indole-3-glycerol-phosphate synthase [Spirochaetota bacterium]